MHPFHELPWRDSEGWLAHHAEHVPGVVRWRKLDQRWATRVALQRHARLEIGEVREREEYVIGAERKAVGGRGCPALAPGFVCRPVRIETGHAKADEANIEVVLAIHVRIDLAVHHDRHRLNVRLLGQDAVGEVKGDLCWRVE